MSWTPTIYTQHADLQTAAEEFNEFGLLSEDRAAIEFDIPPPWEDEEAEIVKTGSWTMLRINLDWDGAEAALTQLEASGCTRLINNARLVFAE